MNALHRIKESPHYPRLRKSVQFSYDRRHFLIIAICFAVLVLPFLALAAAGNEGTAGMAVLWLLVLVGITLFYLYRWLEIFLYIDHYSFCTAQLLNPHTYRAVVSYTITITDRHGNTFQRDTSRMFSSQQAPYLEEYNGRKVLIGYNEKTDRVVVIGLVEH